MLPQYSYPIQPQAAVIVTSEDDAAELLPFADLKLDPATWDMAFPPEIIRGAQAFAQRLRIRLMFFKGEWFLDQRQGMPYFEAILVKNPDITLVQSLFRRTILSTPGALSIAQFRTNFDRVRRVFTLDPLEVVITGGVIFRAQPEEFIVDIPKIGA